MVLIELIFSFWPPSVSWLSQMPVILNSNILVTVPRLPKLVLEVSRKMLSESRRNPVVAAVEKEAGWFLLSSLLGSLQREVYYYFYVLKFCYSIVTFVFFKKQKYVSKVLCCSHFWVSLFYLVISLYRLFLLHARTQIGKTHSLHLSHPPTYLLGQGPHC